MMKMKIAQLQLDVLKEKEENLQKLSEEMERLSSEKPDLIALGEMFVCPYETSGFSAYAEAEGGPLWTALSDLAKKHHVWLSAGTIPESDAGGHIYNTAYVFDRDGRQAAKHRKIHLYDVDLPDGKKIRESDSVTAGDQITVFDTEFGPVGLCVCFDIRFPEQAKEMALRGARLILVPAQFNRTTGPAHWELLFRARAVDNQCFYAGTSVAFDESASYHSYGHSILTSPWGKVIGQLSDASGVQIHEIDLAEADRVRQQMPVLKALL